MVLVHPFVVTEGVCVLMLFELLVSYSYIPRERTRPQEVIHHGLGGKLRLRED